MLNSGTIFDHFIIRRGKQSAFKGQIFLQEGLLTCCRVLDSTRCINDNCGWEHVHTDLTTFHDYAEPFKLTKTCASIEDLLYQKRDREIFVAPIRRDSNFDLGSKHAEGAPVLCTEFGGINIAPSAVSVIGKKDWGYTTADNPDDLLQRLKDLMTGIVQGGLCCGFVYTQLTDIEQEVNGLYTFDRVPKLAVDKVKDVIDATKNLYYSIQEKKDK
jgi:hypothetical protein